MALAVGGRGTAGNRASYTVATSGKVECSVRTVILTLLLGRSLSNVRGVGRYVVGLAIIHLLINLPIYHGIMPAAPHTTARVSGMVRSNVKVCGNLCWRADIICRGR